ncbi:CPCC family cysteine-rich protein [Sphingomonas sp.]|uniref:CPCC family cysteine-rich protein n=1 Tax=Sphingomonas sp. TaxID=28214 RepID=UPI003D6CD14A
MKGRWIACPCCRHRTLAQPAAYEICAVCFWEDDGQSQANADEVWGGPNGALSLLSLTAARANCLRFGACDERFLAHVRSSLPDERKPGS